VCVYADGVDEKGRQSRRGINNLRRSDRDGGELAGEYMEAERAGAACGAGNSACDGRDGFGIWLTTLPRIDTIVDLYHAGNTSVT